MEISLVLVIALMVFGPKKLPELARKLGEGIREFKNASESFKATVNDEAHRAPSAPPSHHDPHQDDHEGPLPTPEQLSEGQDAEVVQNSEEEKEHAVEATKA